MRLSLTIPTAWPHRCNVCQSAWMVRSVDSSGLQMPAASVLKRAMGFMGSQP